MADQNDMLKIVTPMMEYVCDHLCRWPVETASEEDLESICAGCEMGQYMCDILNPYNAAIQLQTAAEVVRNELMEKGDWYWALVESIQCYLIGAGCTASWDYMARELADRITGIESEQEGE
jgi:hypothetical protein